MSTILVIQHVPHERLGTFERAFNEASCSLTLFNAHEPRAQWPSPTGYDGLVVMGGPQSIYEQSKYPFVTKELALIRAAVKADRPILGVCLGAQLLAEALGGKVRPAEQKEIGWYPLMRELGADGDPLFGPFGQTEMVFQWHGDAFALPNGAVRLASSPLCHEQAFRFREHIYGLQFHLEMTEAMIRAWMRIDGNKTELAALRGVIDPMTIRRQSPQHIQRLQELSHHVATAFCGFLTPSTSPSQRSAHVRTR